jgi:mono/diheme cytochrome c family protein
MRTHTISIVLLAVLMAGCGGKSDSNGGASSTAATGSSGSSTPAAVTLPPDLDQGPRAAESSIDESKAALGEKLFQSKGCSACHAFGKRVSCPDLDGVTTRRTAQWIQSQILHPEVMVKQDPTARQLFAQFSLQMPNQGLTPDEAGQVLEFLKHKNHETAEHK